MFICSWSIRWALMTQFNSSLRTFRWNQFVFRKWKLSTNSLWHSGICSKDLNCGRCRIKYGSPEYLWKSRSQKLCAFIDEAADQYLGSVHRLIMDELCRGRGPDLHHRVASWTRPTERWSVYIQVSPRCVIIITMCLLPWLQLIDFKQG